MTIETIYNDDRSRRARILADDDSGHLDPREEETIVEIVTGELRRWNVRTEGAEFQAAFDRFNEACRAGLFQRWLKIFHGLDAAPVYMLEHGNVALRTSGFADPWDSGQIGWAYIKPGTEPWEGWQPAEIIKGFVETLGQWMNGECYGYIIEEWRGDDEWQETDESCWGYIGWEWVEQAAREGL